MLTHSRAPNRPGIAHAIDHHGVGALAFRLDDAGDRAQLRQHDLVVALDRGGAGFDVDEIDFTPSDSAGSRLQAKRKPCVVIGVTTRM